MQSQQPPIYAIMPGRTYRSDSDATHTPMFHQVEGLVIDRGIHLGHLKWTLETFLKAYFERDDIVLRMRPSYFPFTEPSAEIDVGYTMVDGRGSGRMELTLSWLKEHRDTYWPAEAIAEALTGIGREVESVENPAERLAPFRIARILTAERHPQAEKLQLLTVDAGTGEPI